MTTDLGELVRRWTDEIWNQQRDATIDEMASPAMVVHVEGMDTPLTLEDFKAYRRTVLEAIPDVHVEIEQCAVDGNVVVSSWRATGHHQGAGLGVPPTGRKVSFTGASWFEFRDGLIISGWDRWNRGEVMASLTAPEAQDLQDSYGLTPREAEVALLMSQRLTTKEIARDLEIRPNTARRHCQKVLDKMGLHRKEDVADELGVTPGAALLPHGSDLEASS